MRPGFAAAMAMAVCMGAVPAGADTVVRIGLASPLSGPQAHYGIDNRDAAQMAVDELNARPPVVAGQRLRFVLVAADDGADPRMAVPVAQRLVDAGVRAVIGHFNSGVTIPAARIYAAARIPQLSASTSPAYTGAGYKSAFRLVASDTGIGRVLARYAVSRLAARRIVVIDDRTAYGQGLADSFIGALKAEGVATLARLYAADDRALAALLPALGQARPDLVFYGGADGPAARLVRLMSRHGIRARLMGGDMLHTDALIKAAGPQADGLVSAAAGEQLQLRPDGPAFIARYRARFRRDVVLVGPQCYDGVMLVADAMRLAGSIEPARFLPALTASRYHGVTGEFSFDRNGDLRHAPVTVFQVVHNRWVPRAVAH